MNYGYHYEWYVDGLTNGDTTKELNPNESETGILHIKPPATPVDVGDYFTFWAYEVTILTLPFHLFPTNLRP